MMCSSSGEVYAWIGSILVHLSFITIIVWSATSDGSGDAIWKVGLVCSAFYAIILFDLARWLDYRCDRQDHDGEDVPRVNKILVNMLYGAAVLSLVVPGSFLVLQAIHCCRHDSEIRHREGFMLLVVSLPIIMASMVVWRRKGLSSMVATSLIGISLAIRNICMIIDPHSDVFAVGQFVIGAILLVYLSRIKLLDEERPHPGMPIRVFLTVAALNYFSGAYGIFMPSFDVLRQSAQLAWQLLGATVLCFLPLSFLGVATECIPLPILGAIGLFLVALHLAEWLSHASWSSDVYAVPIYGAVLGVMGLIIGSFGMLLDGFKNEIKDCMKSCLSCCLHESETGAVENRTQDEAATPAEPLLLDTA